MLAEQSSAEVRIAYRRPEFGRCRPANKQKLDALLASGRVKALMSTDIAEIHPSAVIIKTRDQERELPNDYLIACLGGESPTEFLKSVGVGIRRHEGAPAMPNPALGGRVPDQREARRSAMTLAVIGAGLLFGMAAVGNGYYLLPREDRFRVAEHVFLRPSGMWGHGVGILATLFMLLNFVYPVRKRVRRFKRKGPIAPWLRFHVFVGLMSPAVILFHSAFQWGNHLATATYVSLVVVGVTGLVGRFIYGQQRLDADHPRTIAETRSSLRPVLERLAGGSARSRRLTALVDGSARYPRTLLGLMVTAPAAAWGLRRALAEIRGAFLDRASYLQVRSQALRLRNLEVRFRLHVNWKRLMRVWRVLHVTLAILLTGLIVVHVWISMRVGLRWFWT
jgi:hypothetical protein